MTVLRLATILIVSIIGGLFAWSVGVPAHLVAWSTAGVVVSSAAITWLTSLHTPPTGFGGQRLQAGDLMPDPSGSGEWVAYLSPGTKLTNATALAVYAVAGVFLVVLHPVPGETALWGQHTNGIFEPVPWLLWIPAVTIWIALTWVIAGYWLYPHLLEDLAHRFVLRELSDKTETLLSAAAGLLGAPIIVPVYVNLLPIHTWAKVAIDCSVLGSATVSIVVWYRRPPAPKRQRPAALHVNPPLHHTIPDKIAAAARTVVRLRLTADQDAAPAVLPPPGSDTTNSPDREAA